jgi:hypothetical protein
MRINDMETNLLALLSTIIIEKDSDAPFRLNEQQSSLAEKECSKPELGKWIDRCDFSFLIETLMLDHAVFSHEFPGVEFPAEERKALAQALESHCDTCVHCHLKRSYDLEWQARVDRAINDNKDSIGKVIARAAGKD